MARRRGWLVRRALFLADLAGIAVGVAFAALLTDGSFWYALIAPLVLLLAKLYGLYDGDEEHAHHSTVGDLIGVFHVITVSAFLVIAFLPVLVASGVTLVLVVLLWAITGARRGRDRAGSRAIVAATPSPTSRTR